MAFISAVITSGITVFLSTLQSFLVSTVGWTLVGTGVSGLSENFVVRSSGVSGDRLIYLKFGASIATQSGISVFACVSFNSATNAASNPTTGSSQFGTFALNSGASITCWFEADLDHVQMFTNLPKSNLYNKYLYTGLLDEFRKLTSATPNLAVVIDANSIDSNSSKIVESQPGNFNQPLDVSRLQTPANRSDPNTSDGLVYLWPNVVHNNTADIVYGVMKNAYLVGSSIADLTNLIASAVDYTVAKVGNSIDLGLAVKMQ